MLPRLSVSDFPWFANSARMGQCQSSQASGHLELNNKEMLGLVGFQGPRAVDKHLSLSLGLLPPASGATDHWLRGPGKSFFSPPALRNKNNIELLLYICRVPQWGYSQDCPQLAQELSEWLQATWPYPQLRRTPVSGPSHFISLSHLEV